MALKKRIIPVLLVKNGYLVRSEKMSVHQVIGNVIDQTKRLNDWNADELLVLDITKEGDHDTGRRDTGCQPYKTRLEMFKAIAAQVHMPLSFGGGIRTYEEAAELIRAGAERVVIRTALDIVPRIAATFGAQAVTICADYTSGWRETDEMAKSAERLGAGEVILHNVPSDGMATGFDCLQSHLTSLEVGIPVVMLGGAGTDQHFAEAMTKCPMVSGYAAANMFNFRERAYPRLKKYLYGKGLNVRPPA